ncbi:hypothetical protein H5410_001977 [Solanum commersonii]|uniref:DUF7746 domain-containing protein n=1 Tax=Solanum commersonii TaxID=4109 RepID=A0A9J6B0R7_SOLCO|nr:hypothetical protein H5410_001977 [Solanum commersonii]
MGTFEKLGLKKVVKTTEETITDTPYGDIYRFMHIGLVQVAFKPLTLRGLPESFIEALRDGTIQTSLAYGPVYFNVYPNLQISLQDENSLSSLMLNVKLHGYDYIPGTEVLNDGTVKIRFSDLSDVHDRIENRSISSRMTRSNSSYISPRDCIVQAPSRASTSQIRESYNIKIVKDSIARPIPREQYDFQEEFYKDIMDSGINRLVGFVPWFMCKHVHNYISMLEKDFTLSNGEITKSVFPPQQTFHINRNDKVVNFNAFSKLFENDTALVTTSHVNAMIKQNNYANIYMSILGEHIVSLNDKVDKLISLLPTKMKGKEKMAHSSLQPPPDIDNFKIKDYSDLEDFLAKKFKGGSLQPINARDFSEGETSHKKEFSDGINKISENYARNQSQRMYYYPRPTPQDVLLEEHEHIITNSYNGKEIYEWNIDGYIDRQIYTTVH